MNWQTEEILCDAKHLVNDESVFSFDQAMLLRDLIELIGKAIEKEVKCNKGSQ